jgi:cytochrome c oxidase subunit 2
MALLLALAIAGITLISMYYFAFAPPQWWLPPFISEYGAAYDRHFMLTLVITGIIFFFAQLGLAFAVFRYRDQGRKAHYSHGNNKLEVLWTAAAGILFVGLVLWGQHIWVSARVQAAPAGALQVEAWGQQFVWYFRYPGPDGVFGRTVPELMKESIGEPLGRDPNDPASRDDIVMPVMAVPVNRPVEVILRSKDVIHSFAVRELRLKQDAVPGLETRLHFTASQTGRWEIPCMELCGLGHYQMRSFLEVKSDADFEQWLIDSAAP